jgi:hypothetical protein
VCFHHRVEGGNGVPIDLDIVSGQASFELDTKYFSVVVLAIRLSRLPDRRNCRFRARRHASRSSLQPDQMLELPKRAPGYVVAEYESDFTKNVALGSSPTLVH